MKDETIEFGVFVVGDRVGVSVTGSAGQDRDGEYCELTPTDFHRNEGFSIRLRLGWRTAEAFIIFGAFSGQLIARMGDPNPEGQQRFVAFATGAMSKKIKVLMRINDASVNPSDPAAWPTSWSKLDLNLRLTPIEVKLEDSAQHEALILNLVVPLFGMVVALIGADETQLPTSGELEGGSKEMLVRRYERNKLNREACIQMKGSRCTVCSFDFAETYGSMGMGYIQVHHVKSAASLGPDYKIDIANDLAPVCANCHAMAHQEDPPVTLARLRQLVEERRGNTINKP